MQESLPQLYGVVALFAAPDIWMFMLGREEKDSS